MVEIIADKLIAQANVLGVSASALLGSVVLLCGVEKSAGVNSECLCKRE